MNVFCPLCLDSAMRFSPYVPTDPRRGRRTRLPCPLGHRALAAAVQFYNPVRYRSRPGTWCTRARDHPRPAPVFGSPSPVAPPLSRLFPDPPGTSVRVADVRGGRAEVRVAQVVVSDPLELALIRFIRIYADHVFRHRLQAKPTGITCPVRLRLKGGAGEGWPRHAGQA
jgi:hypothetical protein